MPIENHQKKVVRRPEAAGPYDLRVVVYAHDGRLLYQSALVAIEVSPTTK
ncbi:hypothetical protein [Cyclobacterium xiamenense]|nr:hypothetical protein [Cyclobacterium xiamenense]